MKKEEKMYREKALKLLERLKSFNYKNKPQYDIDIESKKIIEGIINECKSTTFIKKKNGTEARRYGSSFTIQAVENIVNELIANSSKISRQTMNKLLYENGAYAGLDTDVEIYKGIDSETVRFGAYLSSRYIDERDYKIPGIRDELEEIFKKYARDIIINESNSEKNYLPQISKFRIFLEKVLHKPFSIQKFEQEYKELLKKHSGIDNEEVLANSAKYKVSQITSPRFLNGVLDSIKNGTAIITLNRKADKFSDLQNQIAAEIFEQLDNIPNLNETLKDVNQIFKDVETQLTAYTIDFRGIEPEQIEKEIQRLNTLSLVEEKSQYIGEDGYRNCNVGITGKEIKLMPKQSVKSAMKIFSEDLSSFVNSSEEISDRDYMKMATILMYRFIRIHPFPDSNGRTSRAILNALTLNRNILVSFSKNEKDEFLKISNLVHSNLGEEYLERLCSNTEGLLQMEEENIGELVNFVIDHSTFKNPEQESEDRDKNVKELEEKEK